MTPILDTRAFAQSAQSELEQALINQPIDLSTSQPINQSTNT